jgi:hypothetical protein
MFYFSVSEYGIKMIKMWGYSKMGIMVGICDIPVVSCRTLNLVDLEKNEGIDCVSLYEDIKDAAFTESWFVVIYLIYYYILFF